MSVCVVRGFTVVLTCSFRPEIIVEDEAAREVHATALALFEANHGKSGRLNLLREPLLQVQDQPRDGKTSTSGRPHWALRHIPGLRELFPRGTVENLIWLFYLSSIILFVVRYHQRYVPRESFECVNGLPEALDPDQEYLSYHDVAFYIPSLLQMTVNVCVFCGAVLKIHRTHSKVKAVDSKQLTLTSLPFVVLIIAWFVTSTQSAWFFCQVAIDVTGYGFMILVWGFRWERSNESAGMQDDADTVASTSEQQQKLSPEQQQIRTAVRQHRIIFRRGAAVLHFILFCVVIVGNLIYESSTTLRSSGTKYFASLIEDILVFEMLTVVVYNIHHDLRNNRHSHGHQSTDHSARGGEDHHMGHPGHRHGSEKTLETDLHYSPASPPGSPHDHDPHHQDFSSSDNLSSEDLTPILKVIGEDGSMHRARVESQVSPLTSTRNGAETRSMHDRPTIPEVNPPPGSHEKDRYKQDPFLKLTHWCLLFFYLTNIATYRFGYGIETTLLEHEHELNATRVTCGGVNNSEIEFTTHTPFSDEAYLALAVTRMMINALCLTIASFAACDLYSRIKPKEEEDKNELRSRIQPSLKDEIEWHPQWMPLWVAGLCLLGVLGMWFAYSINHDPYHVIQLIIDGCGYVLQFLFWGFFPKKKKLDFRSSFLNITILSVFALLHSVFFLMVLIYHFVHETTTTFQEGGLPYLIAMLENIALFEVLHMIIHRLDDAWKDYNETKR
jgi:hypothetical protein